MPNVKNYTEQCGEKTIIGGTLEFKENAELIGIDIGFTPAEYQANTTAGNLYGIIDDFNLLLGKLRMAGLMKGPQ